MIFGYNTNGFAHHRLEDALAIMAEMGYGAVGLTLDYHVLDPFEPDLASRTAQVRKLLEKNHLQCVVETGARFLLDPRRKHQPTLLSPTQEERERRQQFLRLAVDIASDLGAQAVSFWSGISIDQVSQEEIWDRLVQGLSQLTDHAASRQVRLAFEPEPGMFIDTMAKFGQLQTRINNPWFGLTMDLGHLHCQGEVPIAAFIHRWRACLWNIHIEDMCRGIHDHLLFGEGEIDFPPVLKALDEIGFQGVVQVELSRHSHDAVRTAQRSLDFLKRAGQGKV